MRSYGKLWLVDDGASWEMTMEPHVAMMAKRVFGKLPAVGSHFRLGNTPQNCFELRWFIARYPLDCEDTEVLNGSADRHHEKIVRLNQLIDPNYKPAKFDLALPARDYQALGADMWLQCEELLIADQVGLGKTALSIAGMVSGKPLPVLVTTLAHLPKQWEREINRFAPNLHTHILKTTKPYELPKIMGRGPDVIISSYHKLAGWCDVLAEYCSGVVFDEVQELRRTESLKYDAAKIITQKVKFKLGLSGTPIYNYGGEMWNVMEQLCPGRLGSQAEFEREWCTDKSLKDPDAFGSFLREQHMMLRRTRKDVGRELPELQKITVPIDSDAKALNAVTGRAGELARILLSGGDGRGDAMRAAGEFETVMRQATGLAKAPFVAAFVEMLLDQDIPVILYGWHHAVYEVWMEELKRFKPALYTGKQSTTQKQESFDRFVNGDTNLIIVSLRAGAGLDGLQKRCATTVHGELDWSPGIIEQDIGRVLRDGQESPVISYLLLSDSGTDPIMAEVLGLKSDQIDGIRGSRQEMVQRVDTGDVLKKLARKYLDAAKGTIA